MSSSSISSCCWRRRGARNSVRGPSCIGRSAEDGSREAEEVRERAAGKGGRTKNTEFLGVHSVLSGGVFGCYDFLLKYWTTGWPDLLKEETTTRLSLTSNVPELGAACSVTRSVSVLPSVYLTPMRPRTRSTLVTLPSSVATPSTTFAALSSVGAYCTVTGIPRSMLPTASIL